jgi:hypothetical protein
MAQKILKGIWFLSLLVFLVVFIYDYAALPENITLGEGESALSMSRDGLFYAFIGAVAIINMLVFVVTRLFAEKNTDFKSWFYGMVAILNLFFIVAISFIGLLNSNERFDYERIGIIIYGSVGLIAVWAMGWPILVFLRKYIFKQPV